MKKNRGFEVVDAWIDQDIVLPERKTAQSAGYDIQSAETIDIPPGEVAIVPTGIKAYMPADEYLAVYIRSSMAIKHGIMLANGTGIIDADYYNNAENEGHIMCALYNASAEVFRVLKGDRIAQGIFMRYQVTDDDEAEGIRTGGIGSTGRS